MAKKEPDFTIEKAKVDQESFADIFELAVLLQMEAGIFPLDRRTAAENVYHTISENMTFVARDNTGRAIGTIGLEEVQVFYSKETILWDKWFYVRPEYRNGIIGKELLRSASAEGEKRGKITIATISNPDRQRRNKRMAQFAQDIGYIPRSYSIRLR